MKSRRFSWAFRMNSPRSRALVVCGGRPLASNVASSGTQSVDESAPFHQVEKPTVAADVVIGQVELGDACRTERQVVLGAVSLDHLVLDNPVDLTPHGSQISGVDSREGALPQAQNLSRRRVVEGPVGQRTRGPSRSTPSEFGEPTARGH